MKMKRLAIYDFDGTLIDSPIPETGKKIWKDKTGETYPHVGWWGRKESLDTEVFDIKPFPSVLKKLREDIDDDDTTTVILTSRMEKLRSEVENILKLHDIEVDDVLLKKGRKDKGDVIMDIQKYHEDLTEIVVYDDFMNKDEKKIEEYTKIKSKLPEDIKYVLNYVGKGKISLLETIDSVKLLADILTEEIAKFNNDIK